MLTLLDEPTSLPTPSEADPGPSFKARWKNGTVDEIDASKIVTILCAIKKGCLAVPDLACLCQSKKEKSP